MLELHARPGRGTHRRGPSTAPPYLYPLAGLPKAITIDQTGSFTDPASPLETESHTRRERVVSSWTVLVSADERPYPVQQVPAGCAGWQRRRTPRRLKMKALPKFQCRATLLLLLVFGVMSCADASPPAVAAGGGDTSGSPPTQSTGGGGTGHGASGGTSSSGSGGSSGLGDGGASSTAGMQNTGGSYVPSGDVQCYAAVDLDTAGFSTKLKEPIEPKRLLLRIEWVNKFGMTPCSLGGLIFAADRGEPGSDHISLTDTAVTSWEGGALFIRVPEDDGLARDLYDIRLLIKGCDGGYVASALRKDAASGPGTLIAECGGEPLE
jgi:hypothetical protein